jgi:thiamine biosynthesis lipoprotein
MTDPTGAPTLQLRLESLEDLVDAGRLTWTLGDLPRRAASGWAQVSFRAMGSAIRAQIESDDPRVEEHLKRVPEWFETWEARLSRFRPESELSRLNARAGEMVAVSPILWQVIRRSLEAAEISHGLVTPTVLPALEAAGYDRPFAEMERDAAEGVVASREVPDWRGIRLDPKRRRLCLPPGAKLDLGGIGKGWAADRAVARLKHLGRSMVEAGGDIALGAPGSRREAWRIAVADPQQPDRDLVDLVVSSGGVATSGKDYRRWRRAGAWQHHLIDPRTGLPSASDVWSATVIAPSLQTAEIAAKTVVILGADEGLAWIERRPNLATLLILEDGTRIDSHRLQDHVWRH